MPKRFILASASPRRRELLALLGLPFDVIVSEVDETALSGRLPAEVPDVLARAKALAVWERLGRPRDTLILGADTDVVATVDGVQTILGKPADAEDARRMLRALSGRMHTVYTGLTLVQTVGDEPTYVAQSELVDTQVKFRRLTDAMIDAYIATGEPFDKAGAYGIQGRASAFVQTILGDYFNVVGLPVQRVGRMLEDAGIEWWRGPAALEEP